MSLISKIISELEEHPGSTAKDIALILGIERSAINSALYKSNQVKRDNNYRWYILKDTPKDEKIDNKYLDTDLAKLSGYYQEMINFDSDQGYRVFATSKYKRLNYFELDALDLNSPHPFFSNTPMNNPLSLESWRSNLDLKDNGLFIGGPIYFNKVKTQNGEFSFLNPIFVIPLFDDNSVDFSSISLNPKIFTIGNDVYGADLKQELESANEFLGLSNPEITSVNFEDIIAGFESLKPELNWKEKISLDHINNDYSFENFEKLNKEQGIYNKFIVFVHPKSQFTRGLSYELSELRKIPASKYSKSILGYFLDQKENLESDKKFNDFYQKNGLLEVLPLNDEQREVVRSSLDNPLTVVTGPPGTGKSQVVSSIILNSVLNGQRILFASKNNKAVDVVEERVNSLGATPIVMRTGSYKYASRFGEFITSILSLSASEDDKKKYYEDLNQYRLIQYEIDELSNTQKDLVNRRNESYSKEKEVKNIEKRLGGEIFKFCSETDILLLKKNFRKYSELIDFCDINKQNFINKLFFNFIKNKRFIDTNKKIKPILDDFNNFLKEKLPTNISDKTLNSFRVSISELEKRIIDIEKINDFIEHTNESFDWEQLSEISGKKSENYTVLNNIGHDVWNNWLKIVPFALDRETRQSLASVSAQINQIKYETEQGLKELQRAIIRNLDKLRSAKILNAWALTSLSVNSKIPMEAAYFDLVIFDEASQCDIASALPLLYRAKRAVIIGDPFQLKHISSATAMQEKASRNKWNIQEASWWYTPNSLYDMAAGKVDKVVSLLNHHRSHADIIEFSNQTFYSNRLRILTSYRSLKSLREGPAVRWLNCSGKTIRPLNKSAQNQAEANSITKELRRLVLEQQYAGSIGVVTPFRGQVDAIMKNINADNDLKSALIKRNFLCDTVDRFQGDERDLMFFSCVISDGAAKSAIGFLSNDRNRFNVAVTRARGSLIIVGNRSYIENSGVKYLEDLSKYVASKSEKDKVTIEKLPGENYPKVSNPESVSNLEKIFYEALYNNEIHTIPQYPVENYRLDLALITKNNQKLDIEIDGRDHYQGQKWTNELVIRDQLRNQRLYELGWDVIRFTNPQISNNLNKSIEVIKNWQKQDHLMYSHRSFNKMYPYV